MTTVHADTRSATRHRGSGGGTGRARRAAASISSVQPVDGCANAGSGSWLIDFDARNTSGPAQARSRNHSHRGGRATRSVAPLSSGSFALRLLLPLVFAGHVSRVPV